jgi:hypothetical protein
MNFKSIVSVFAAMLMFQAAFAGNPDRAGQAGASELLVNPWARSLGLNGINIASVKGIDAMRLNVGGLTFVDRTQVAFSRTEYLVGSGIGINSLGFAQKLGDGAFGLSIMNVSYGDIEITTTDQPEGGIGTYTPQFLNIGLSYSRSFADFIHGGVVLRIVNESIANLNASGVAIDAGLVYTTGDDAHPDKFKFGVSLRNVGTPMTFRGDGLQFPAVVPSGAYSYNTNNPTQAFELPSQLNIGASYDVYVKTKHRITANGSFTSNAFYRDQFGLGLEYGLKINNREVFMLRAGYKYEDGLLNDAVRGNVHTGFAGGFTVDIPFSRDEALPRMGIDYAYRTSDPFEGSHTVGLRLDF